MLAINIKALEEGLMVTGRNPSDPEAILIRIGVHSFTNHNAMVVKDKDGNWKIAEAVSPESVLTSIEDYEELLNGGYLVRFYRLKTLSSTKRKLAAKYFVDNLIGLKYPQKKKMVLLAMPVVNFFIDTFRIKTKFLRQNWCSQLDKKAFVSQDENCLDGVNNKKKELFTPKTFENRIMFGIFEDVTDKIVVEK